jgi:hypothetical protein
MDIAMAASEKKILFEFFITEFAGAAAQRLRVRVKSQYSHTESN